MISKSNVGAIMRLSLFSLKQYKNTILGFRFCDISNNQGRFHPSASADNTQALDIDYSADHKNVIQELFLV